MKRNFCLVVAVLALILFTHMNIAEAAKPVKLGFVTEDSSTWAEGARKFKELVGKRQVPLISRFIRAPSLLREAQSRRWR